jgi:hypothetical protein
MNKVSASENFTYCPFRILETGEGEEKFIPRVFEIIRDTLNNEVDRDGDILYEGSPDWYKETAEQEKPETRKLKRTCEFLYMNELRKI